MKNSRTLFIAFFVLIIIIASELIIYSNYSSYSGKKKHITYITYGQSADSWSEMKEGALAALKEENADVTVVTSLLEDGVEGQIALIEEAVNSNCDAIVIAPLYTSKIDEYIKSINTNKRVIVLNSAKDGSVYHLHTGEEAIGETVGNNVAADEKKSVLIVSFGYSDSIVSRREALEGILDENAIQYTEFCAEDRNFDYLSLRNYWGAGEYDGIIALDELSVAAVADAMQNGFTSADIYGVSNTREAVYWLDKGVVKNLIYIDEFSFGYVSSQMAFKKKLWKKEYSDSINFYDVKKENMYEDDLSKVLFPFDN